MDKQGLIQVKGKQIHVEDGRRLAQVTSMRDPKEGERESEIDLNQKISGSFSATSNGSLT